MNRGTLPIERDNCSLPGKTASVPDMQGFDFTLANATSTWYMTRNLFRIAYTPSHSSPENTTELLTYHHHLHAVAGSADSSRQTEIYIYILGETFGTNQFKPAEMDW